MKKKKKREKQPLDPKLNYPILITKITLFIICLFVLVSLFASKSIIHNDIQTLRDYQFTFWDLFSGDRPSVSNPVGIIGSLVAYQVVYLFGQLFSLLSILLILTHLTMNLSKTEFPQIKKWTIFLPLMSILLYLIHFYILNQLTFPPQNYEQAYIFFSLYKFFVSVLGRVGTLIFCIISLIALLRMVLVYNPFIILKNFFVFLYESFKKEENEDDDTSPEDHPIDIINLPPDNTNTPLPHSDNGSNDEFNFNDNEDNETPYFHPKPAVKQTIIDGQVYQKPDVDSFLYTPPKDKKIDKNALLEENKKVSQILKQKLAEFNIEATVLNVNLGPIITQYELEPAPGIKVNKFTALSDDLALALKAKSIRVQAPIPGRGLIGVEVPNVNADVIYMRDIFMSPEMYNSNAILSIALGKDIAGRPIITDLAKTPHLLIAGATGSGKSVCINTIICSILLRCTPEEVRLVMIDPKRIELSGYDGIPHLIESVVTEPEDAMNTLTWAVYEMEGRYELLQESKVRDIVSYNQKIEELLKNDEAEIIDKLPYIVLIVDEFADLIMTAGREIELPIARLAQMARAIGIHLILATQRPSIKVITGVIKANFPARIAFRVSSKVDSRVILDSTGADKLLGRGDMLFLPPGKANPERIHGAYLSDSEIEGLVEYLRTQPRPELNIIMNKPEIGDISDFEYDDDLFPEAARVIVNSNLASVSMLQRHFKIGYARAGRLIDLLERAGVIGPHQGSKPREVLMSKEDLQNLN